MLVWTRYLRERSGDGGHGRRNGIPPPSHAGGANDDFDAVISDSLAIRDNFGNSVPGIPGDADTYGVARITDLNNVRNNFARMDTAIQPAMERSTSRI